MAQLKKLKAFSFEGCKFEKIEVGSTAILKKMERDSQKKLPLAGRMMDL